MSGASRSPVTIRTDRLTIEGTSRAGNETWFRLRELGVALDLGRCPDLLVSMPHVLISHAHLDHALGIPFYAAQRNLQGQAPGSVYVPAETLEDFRELMRIHERLEGTTYDLRMVGLAPGDSVRLRRNLVARAHRAMHRVPTNAWELLESRHKLRAELAALPETEIARLHRSGETIEQEVQHSLLFYTGDTDRGILEENDSLFRAEVLIIECSFSAPEHLDRAEKYRHIHVEDLWEFGDRFENHSIVLSHFSLRYTPEEIRRMIGARCPARLRERIRLVLPEPYDRID